MSLSTDALFKTELGCRYDHILALGFTESFVLACSGLSYISVEQSHAMSNFTICFIKYTEISYNKAGDKTKTPYPLQSLRGVIFVVIKNYMILRPHSAPNLVSRYILKWK